MVGKWKGNGGMGAVYGLGFIGALVWYIQHAADLIDGLLGVGKALVWPALLVYKLIDVLKF